MTGFEWLWLFLAYSFLGWVLETAGAAVRQKRFVNRGLVNGPFCVIYGVAALVITYGGQELSGIWLFIGSAVIATVTEWCAGHILERVYHEKWWDYSGRRWNLDGYICLSFSLLWGALGTLGLKFGNPLLLRLFGLLPATVGRVAVWILLAALALDAAATAIILRGFGGGSGQWEQVDSWFDGVSRRLGSWVYGKVNGRIAHAYPRRAARAEARSREQGFARGCSFYKIVLLFVIGSFLGDITETIFCRVRAGVWMSRSSLVWGPFSIVWGFAIAAVTVLLYRYKDSSDRFLFLMGTVLGGVYEYLCSVVTEKVFGTIFWDYSSIPFNLGGRINLLYCFFWGFAAVVWFKVLYPPLSAWIERIAEKPGKVVTWLLLVFMCCNMAVSSLALARSDERSRGVAAEHGWQQVMDERFGDERLQRIYPNAIRVGDGTSREVG